MTCRLEVLLVEAGHVFHSIRPQEALAGHRPIEICNVPILHPTSNQDFRATNVTRGTGDARS